MSSPYLNNIIVVGCMLTYTSVILLGMDSGLSSEANFPIICAVSRINLTFFLNSKAMKSGYITLIDYNYKYYINIL